MTAPAFAVTFDPMSDYKKYFADSVDYLIKLDITNREERIRRIDMLCESYVATIGKSPDPYQLTLLANYVLKEEITDKDGVKSRKSDYSFLSEDQLDRRERKETALGKLAYCLNNDGKMISDGTRFLK